MTAVMRGLGWLAVAVVVGFVGGGLSRLPVTDAAPALSLALLAALAVAAIVTTMLGRPRRTAYW